MLTVRKYPVSARRNGVSAEPLRSSKCTTADSRFPFNRTLRRVTDFTVEDRVDVIQFRRHADYGRRATFGATNMTRKIATCTTLNPFVWNMCAFDSDNPPAVMYRTSTYVEPSHLSAHNRKVGLLCSQGSYIIRHSCVFVELWGARNKNVPGAIFDTARTFTPQIYARSARTDYRPALQRFPHAHLAVILLPYTYATGHFVHETLARVVWLLETLPSHILILAPRGGRLERYYTFLHERGVNTSRVLPYQNVPKSVIYVENLYTVYEWPFCHQEGNPNIGGEPSEYPYEIMSKLRDYFTLKSYGRKETQIVVVNRGNSARKVEEHVKLMRELQAAFAGSKIVEFGPSDLDRPLIEHIEIFSAATVVVGPHGAGLGNIVYCKEGTAVVEIGFDGHEGMQLDEMYYQLSMGLHLRYWLVMGRGSYYKSISVDVSEIIDVITQAMRGVEPNWVDEHSPF